MQKLGLILIFYLSVNCSGFLGQEVGRLSINEVSKKNNKPWVETAIELNTGNDIDIWSELDIEYEGILELSFKLEVLRNGEPYRQLNINPMDKNLTMNEIKTSIMNKTSWSFSAKNTTVNIEEDANYTFRTFLLSSENPTLIIKKAEIILRK
ncbi:MAG: hypothetical protein MK207_10655 [Saprospiraceae bacterium]|nr:hypothetical protein [Saprospiraceae bacterium]